MNRPPMHSVGEISRMLAARTQDLVGELLPMGRREGAEWRCGSLAGERGQSLAVHLHGAKAGVWCDFASGQRGDVLDLVAQVRFGGDLVEALRWSRMYLGLGHTGGGFRTVQAAAPLKRPDLERDDAGRRASARAMWLDGVPIPGTPVAAYLAGRGIELAELGRVPGALRFLPECWCGEVKLKLPAMVAAITRRGVHVATHRTWLMCERGTWRKARLQAAKKVLGGFAGGVIALHRGQSGKPLAQAPENDTVALCEGVEDALTLALHMPEWRALAVVSLGNMGAVQLPPQLADVMLVFDRDGENPQARQARERAVKHFMEEGRSVREQRPPEGFKDMNEWHQAWRAEAAARREGVA